MSRLSRASRFGQVLIVAGSRSADAEAVRNVVLVVDAAERSGVRVGAAGEAAQERAEWAAAFGDGAERHQEAA